MADRLQATLNGFPLDIETIRDSVSNSIVKHEFPFRKGAKLQNMGQGARTISFRCYWFGATYEAHFSVLAELDKLDLFELVHPVYGLLKGAVENLAINHDDREETAAVDFDFVVEEITNAEPRRVLSVAEALEASFEAGQVEQMAAFGDEVTAAIGIEAADILARELNPDTGILAQFTGVSLSARAYLKTVDTAVQAYEASLAGVANPANSLIASIDYGLTLPGRVVGALSRTVERYSLLLEKGRNAPSQFLESLRNQLVQLEQSALGLLSQLRLAGSQRLSLEAGYLFGEDDTRRRAQRRQDAAPTFDPAGHFIPPEPPGALMTVAEAEDAIGGIREYIQAAIDDARGMAALKTMARDLQQHVSAIAVEYERIVPLTIDSSLPVHLVCLKAKLPYTYASRILAINPSVKRPNFIEGEVSVYAR